MGGWSENISITWPCLCLWLTARGKFEKWINFREVKPNIEGIKRLINISRQQQKQQQQSDTSHDNLHTFWIAFPAIAPTRFDQRVQPY
jgi:hypothetical protein